MEADSDVEIVTSVGTKTVEATRRRKPTTTTTTEPGYQHLKPTTTTTTEPGYHHLKPTTTTTTTTERGRVSDTWGPRKMRRTEEQTEKREIWRYFRTNHKTYVGMRKEKVSAVFESDEDAGGSQPKRVIVVDEQRSKTINTEKTFDTEIYAISDSDSDISDILEASNPEEQERKQAAAAARKKQRTEAKRTEGYLPEDVAQPAPRTNDLSVYAALYDEKRATYNGRPVLDCLRDRDVVVARLEQENQELKNKIFALQLAAASWQ